MLCDGAVPEAAGNGLGNENSACPLVMELK